MVQNRPIGVTLLGILNFILVVGFLSGLALIVLFIFIVTEGSEPGPARPFGVADVENLFILLLSLWLGVRAVLLAGAFWKLRNWERQLMIALYGLGFLSFSSLFAFWLLSFDPWKTGGALLGMALFGWSAAYLCRSDVREAFLTQEGIQNEGTGILPSNVTIGKANSVF